MKTRRGRRAVPRGDHTNRWGRVILLTLDKIGQSYVWIRQNRLQYSGKRQCLQESTRKLAIAV
jgi:hypothetical protein